MDHIIKIISTILVEGHSRKIWEKMCSLDIIKTNIQQKFQHAKIKNTASRVLTRFSFNLAYWPSFWHNMTHIRIWPKYHQDKLSDKSSRCSSKQEGQSVPKSIHWVMVYSTAHAENAWRKTRFPRSHDGQIFFIADNHRNSTYMITAIPPMG